MGYSIRHIENLQEGNTVKFRPKGNSMKPKIKSGQLCTVMPIAEHILSKGDIVYCKVKGRQYLHLISAVKGDRYQISNNRGHVNGWIGVNQIFGLLTEVSN